MPALTGLASASAQSVSEQEAYETAKDAHVYAYPLVVTHTTPQQFSNFAEPVAAGGLGPPNRFNHARAFPNPDDKIAIPTMCEDFGQFFK